MFGLFGKSFNSEMAEFDKEAKKIGPPMAIAMRQGDFVVTQRLLEEINELTKKRIDCCKKYGKTEELRHWISVAEQGNKLAD
jgi:hypothetical protein